MKNFKSIYISIVITMIFLVVILGFSQLSTEICVYGFIAHNTTLRAGETSENSQRYSVEQCENSSAYLSEQNEKSKLHSSEQKKTLKRYLDETSENSRINSGNSEENFVSDYVEITVTGKKICLKKPVVGVTTSVFGDEVARSISHKGHDWAVRVGTPVMAAEDGIVEKAYYSASYGYNILLKHSENLKTRYAHLSKLSVQVGEKVQQGQIIGLSGSTGESTGPHLHFEVEKDGIKVNPIDYLE